MQHTSATSANTVTLIEMRTSQLALNPSGFKLRLFAGAASGDGAGVSCGKSTGEPAVPGSGVAPGSEDGRRGAA